MLTINFVHHRVTQSTIVLLAINFINHLAIQSKIALTTNLRKVGA